MLVLTRKKGESLMIGDTIELVVLGIEGDQIKLGINAPRHVKIHRSEIYRMIQEANREAAVKPLPLDQLKEMMQGHDNPDQNPGRD